MGHGRTLFRNQCNINTIGCLTLQWDVDKASMLYSGHLNVACIFLGTMKLTDWSIQLKPIKNQIMAGSLWRALFYDHQVLSYKNLYIAG